VWGDAGIYRNAINERKVQFTFGGLSLLVKLPKKYDFLNAKDDAA
jgi:hypothetical protein